MLDTIDGMIDRGEVRNLMGYGMMGGGGIFGILILTIVFFLVIRLFNNFSGYNPNNSYTRNNDALETLKERFARGEISEEEYERKRKIIKD